jgi:hypothetical protein
MISISTLLHPIGVTFCEGRGFLLRKANKKMKNKKEQRCTACSGLLPSLRVSPTISLHGRAPTSVDRHQYRVL